MCRTQEKVSIVVNNNPVAINFGMILKAYSVVYIVKPLSFFKGAWKGNNNCGNMDISRKSFK
jgi:hypothetical protein